MNIPAIGMLTVVLLCATIAKAQNKVIYQNSPFERTFTRCEHPPTFGKDSLSLQNYFIGKLNNKIYKTKGQIKISLLIDTTGQTGCEYIEDNTNLNMSKHQLKSVVDAMPNWNIAFQNNHKVNCVELILLSFDDNKLTVTCRMGRD